MTKKHIKHERYRLDGIISSNHQLSWLNHECGELLSSSDGYVVIDFGNHGKWRLPSRYVATTRQRRTLQLLDQVADDALLIDDNGDDAAKSERGTPHGDS